jgi:hypothetical protein
MEDKVTCKLTGDNSIVDFSADAKYLIIGGYDGGFKVFDTAQNKICCKTKLKGSKNDIIIWHQAISLDNKYAAFSALKKVFLMDIAKNEIIWEFEFSIAERRMTVPFCFFNHSPQLVIPDGDRLQVYDIETEKSYNITLPLGAGFTDCIAVSPNDTHIAYKSMNGSYDLRFDREGNITSYTNEYKENMSDRVFIYDIATGKCVKTVNVLCLPNPVTQGTTLVSGTMQFVDNGTIAINRIRPVGFSYYNIQLGKETQFIDWKKKGLEFGRFDKAKIYANGRFVLFNNETPDPKTIKYNGNIATEYAVPIPEGLEYILYDTKEDKIIYRQKNGEPPTAFHPETKQFAYLKREWDENHKRTEYLCIRNIETQ